jgi:DNA-binding response OmpR family regulator
VGEPFAPLPPTAPTQAVKPNPVALLIDDDKANRRLLRMLLGSQHYRLLESVNGRLGLAAARACRPDVIILELSLPGISGLTVLKRLRQSCPTPVLVLTVRNREKDAVAALDADGDFQRTYSTSGYSGRL